MLIFHRYDLHQNQGQNNWVSIVLKGQGHSVQCGMTARNMSAHGQGMMTMSSIQPRDLRSGFPGHIFGIMLMS